MTRKTKTRREPSQARQQAGFPLKAGFQKLAPLKPYILIIAAAILVGFGLNNWHRPVQVRVELQSTAVRLNLVDSDSLMNYLPFEWLNLSGIQTLEFSPQVTQQPRYQGNPQAEVVMDTKGSLSGLDLTGGSTLVITCTAPEWLKLQLPSLTLDILPDNTQPALQADKFNPTISTIPWPNSANKLLAIVVENAQLYLKLADNQSLNLLGDKQELKVAQIAFGHSSTVYSSLENGKISYVVDNTKLDDVDLKKGKSFLIKPTANESLSVYSLKLDTKQGILSINLEGMAGQIEADGKDLLPSVMERLWKHSLRDILVTVVVSVFTVLSAIIVIYEFFLKGSKSA